MAMMFAGLSKKRGPFDLSPETYGTPGIGDGLPGATPMGDPGLGAPQMAPQGKPDFFGAGGTGRNIAGYIGDALAQLGGMEPVYAPQMQRRSDEQRKLSLYQQQRRDGLEDFATKQQIEAKYAKPGALPDVIQLQTIADDPAQPPNIRKAALDRVTALNDPIVNANVGGRDFFGPRSLLLENIGKGGDPVISPAPGASPPPASAGPGVPHLTVDQMRSIGQGVNFSQWQQRQGTPVLVNSAEEMARVPVGTMVISPDGRRGVKR